MAISCYSQDQKLTVKQVDSLRQVLKGDVPQTVRIHDLIELGWYQVRKRGENKIDLDSAKYFLDQAGELLRRVPEDPNWGFYYLVYSSYHNESGQKPLDQQTLDKAIYFLNKDKQYHLLGNAYYEKMNRIPISSEVIPQKLRWMELSTDAYKKTSDKRKLGDSYRLLADLRIYVKDDPRALPELDSANRLYLDGKSGDWQQLYIVYSDYYYRQANSEKQLEYVFKALRTTGLDDHSSIIIHLYNSASVCYFRLKENKKALEYSLDALNYAIKVKVPVPIIYTLAQGVVRNYSKLNRPRDAYLLLNTLEKKYPQGKDITDEHLLIRMINYTDLKRYGDAQNYFNQLYDWVRTGGRESDSLYLCTVYDEMNKFLVKSGQLRKAAEVFDRWKPYAIKVNNKTMRLNYYNGLLMLDTAKQDFKSAVHHLLTVKDLSDSIYTSSRIRQIKEMEYQFRVDRKESENKLQRQNIANLTSQQKLQNAQLRATDVLKNIMVGTAVCLIVIALLIYRQFVLSKKYNQVVARKNDHLQHLLEENEFLMKEVHHRVKNNLQIVTSLLNSQSAYLEEGNALDAIMKSKGRVEAIALIHQKLYKSESQSTLYMPEYIQELTEYLKDSFLGEERIWFDLIIDPLYLDVADAVPIGLIINESITNSIKYAFKGPQSPREKAIRISLTKGDFFHELTIRDNGKGFNDSSVKGNGSFGLLLIQGLTKDLGGELIIHNDGGAVISIIFNPTIIVSQSLDHLQHA